MRTLHLAPDDKFIPQVRDAFEAANPCENRFRVQVPRGEQPKFIKPAPNTKIVYSAYFSSPELREDLAWCDVLICHAMDVHRASAVLAAPPDITVVWAAWGFEFYSHLPSYRGRLVLPKTAALVPNPFLGWIGRGFPLGEFKAALKVRVARLLQDHNWHRKIAPRIDYFCWWSRREYDEVASIFPGFRAEYLPDLSYYSVEAVFRKGPVRMDGPNILVGNSAAHTNNHAEAFEFLAALPLEGRKLIVPLSYGDTVYANAVCDLGSRLFGDKFVALRDFMPLERYNEVISSCGTIVFAHSRAHALGNFSSGLYKGAKVFLPRHNPLYDYYAVPGAHIFPLPDTGQVPKDFFNPLSQEQLDKNRRVVESIWLFENCVASTRAMLDRIAAGRAAAKVDA
jgi:hypothetical protein